MSMLPLHYQVQPRAVLCHHFSRSQLAILNTRMYISSQLHYQWPTVAVSLQWHYQPNNWLSQCNDTINQTIGCLTAMTLSTKQLAVSLQWHYQPNNAVDGTLQLFPPLKWGRKKKVSTIIFCNFDILHGTCHKCQNCLISQASTPQCQQKALCCNTSPKNEQKCEMDVFLHHDNACQYTYIFILYS